MKIFLTTVKVIVLITAAVTAILRFISFKYAESFSPETLKLFSVISIISGALLVLAGVVWVLLEKRLEKAAKEK